MGFKNRNFPNDDVIIHKNNDKINGYEAKNNI